MSLQAHFYGVLGAHLLSVGTAQFELMEPWRNRNYCYHWMKGFWREILPQACPGEDRVEPSCFLLSSSEVQALQRTPSSAEAVMPGGGRERLSVYATPGQARPG